MRICSRIDRKIPENKDSFAAREAHALAGPRAVRFLASGTGAGAGAAWNIVAEVRSIYRWNDGVDDEREQLLLIKTTEERVEALREALLARHPYEVPEFVVLPAEAHGAYGDWLLHSV